MAKAISLLNLLPSAKADGNKVDGSKVDGSKAAQKEVLLSSALAKDNKAGNQQWLYCRLL